jgi:hypothetical protein
VPGSSGLSFFLSFMKLMFDTSYGPEVLADGCGAV